jgi:RNA polymerase sigma factor (sigma-70 family)
VSQSRLDPTSAPVPCPESSEAGKEQAVEFDKFFLDHQKKIVRTVMYSGACFDDACDAVQEAMILAASRFGKLQYPGAWVSRVAVRIYIRKSRRDQEVRHRELGAPRSPTVQDSDPDLLSSVRTELQNLPPVQRMIMALTIEGHSPTEIAEILGKSTTAVRGSLRCARQAMSVGLKRGGWNV